MRLKIFAFVPLRSNNVGVTELGEAFAVAVAVIARGFVAPTHNILRTVAITAAAARLPAVQVASALLVAQYWI